MLRTVNKAWLLAKHTEPASLPNTSSSPAKRSGSTQATPSSMCSGAGAVVPKGDTRRAKPSSTAMDPSTPTVLQNQNRHDLSRARTMFCGESH